MTTPAIAVRGASKWYGQVLGLSDVTLEVTSGIVGLLGPNGAGKSTLMKLLVGMLKPSRGTVELFGRPVFGSAEARRRLGYCPEHEGIYEELTAREFVTFMAELSGMSRADARRRAPEALATLGLESAMDRALRGYSKGMRQRAKLAQAFVHEPDVIMLDEPLTGCDPVARSLVINRIRELAREKVVVISSHVLYEIEALTEDIVVMYRGQILAEGNVYRIRELIDAHPHRVRVECDRPRELAKSLLDAPHVTRIRIEDTLVEVETRSPDKLYDEVRDTALDRGIALRSLTSPDDNLQAVFTYLTGGGS